MVVSDVEYDTDTISLTSTVESRNEDGKYNVEQILSEGWEPGEKSMKYLVEWADYPMEKCTWEPQENLEDSGLLTPWAKEKARMGPSKFSKFIKTNEEDYNEACKQFNRLRLIRQQKRARKRSKMRQFVEDNSSENDVPLKQQKPARKAKSKSSEPVPTRSQEVYNSLFVDSQDSNPIGPPPTLDQLELDSTVRVPPAARAPFIEISTDDSDTTASVDSSDSLLVELAEEAKKGTRTTTRRLRQKRMSGLDNSILSPESPRPKIAKPSKKTAAPASPNTDQSMAETTVQALRKPTKLTRTLTAPVVSKIPDSRVAKQKQRRPSESAAQVPDVTTSKDSDVSAPKSPNVTVGAASVRKPANAMGSTSERKAPVSLEPPPSKKTGTSSKVGPPIRITNEKKEPPRREWNTQDTLYKKMKYRGIAEQRGRVEHTPDPAALEFVGSHPPNIVIPRYSRPVDNPYSRREAGYRRAEEVDEDESAQGGLQDINPMEDWEKDKIPLVCPEWRLSRNCKYPPRLCRYLHRDKDANGRNIEIASIDGKVPPKYCKPPVTCPFWLRGPNGCYKTDKECNFAHRNTGWLPNDVHNAAPMPVNTNEKPVSERRELAQVNKGPTSSTNRKMGPIPVGRPSSEQGPAGAKVAKTCWYWANGGCEKPDELCPFKHYDTGIVARLPDRLDQSKSSRPCLYFQKGYCRFTAEQCLFSHSDPKHPNDGDRRHDIPHQAGNNSRALHNVSGAIRGPGQRFSTGRMSHIAHDEGIDTHVKDADEQRPTIGHEDQTPSMLSPLPTVNSGLRTFKLPTAPPRAGSSSLEMKQKIEQALKASFSRMFQWSQDEKNELMLDRKAFLLYHPADHREEIELTTRWLLLHHVEVRSACYEGAWDQYAHEHVENKASSSILVVHPDFELFSKLKNFGKVLQNRVRVWSLGVQEDIAYDPASLLCPSKKDQEYIEVFPAGGFIYITDDVLEARPRQALEIVKLFITKLERLRGSEHGKGPWQEVDNINLHWRICVRPELMEYLFAKCEEQARALEAGDPDAAARAKLYEILSDTNYIEQDSPVLPLSQKADKFPIMSERRSIAKDEPIDYFNALARNREKANLRMIRYYTSLHKDLRRDYRHFYIVHTDPFSTAAKQWLRECATITDIMTPERCIHELSRDGHDGKEQYFDFYERYLVPTKEDVVPAKQVKQVMRIQEEDVMDSQSSLESGEIRSST